MRKLTVLGTIFAICLFTSVATAEHLPDMNITLGGGAAYYYNEPLGSAQIGLELALPVYHEFYLMAEGGGSFLAIPLLNARLTLGPRIQTEDGVVANFGVLYERAQGLDRERPDGNFWGVHGSLLVPTINDIRVGPSVDYTVNSETDAALFFVGLKISLPIDLTGNKTGDYRVRDIHDRR